MAEGKTCSVCRKVKPRDSEHFNKNKAQRDGFANVCKECRALERRTERVKSYNRNYGFKSRHPEINFEKFESVFE